MRSKVLILPSTEDSVYSQILEIANFFPQPFNKKWKKIAIKLNVCSIKVPETGATSHPAVVEALLRVLREKCGQNTEINLVESDATFNRDATVAFKLLGYKSLAEKYGANCVNLSKDAVVEKEIDGYLLKKVNVPQTLVDSDFFISVPKLKTHHVEKITCGLKNQFGCHRVKYKKQFHDRLDEAIVDANLFSKPDFVIVDGILGMGAAGTFFGLTKRFNLLIASDDLVAADCVCAKILGFNPYFVGHIRKAANKQLGSMKYDVFGVKPEAIKVKSDFDKTAFYFEKFYSLPARFLRALKR